MPRRCCPGRRARDVALHFEPHARRRLPESLACQPERRLNPVVAGGRPADELVAIVSGACGRIVDDAHAQVEVDRHRQRVEPRPQIADRSGDEYFVRFRTGFWLRRHLARWKHRELNVLCADAALDCRHGSTKRLGGGASRGVARAALRAGLAAVARSRAATAPCRPRASRSSGRRRSRPCGASKLARATPRRSSLPAACSSTAVAIPMRS